MKQSRSVQIVMVVIYSALFSSCDSWRTVEYSVISTSGTDMEMVTVRRDMRAAVFDAVNGVALQYGLQRCADNRCKINTCRQFRSDSCEEFQAPMGTVQGYGAPVVRLLNQDDGHDIIQITYFVGPTKPFINFERDLKAELEERGVEVVR